MQVATTCTCSQSDSDNFPLLQFLIVWKPVKIPYTTEKAKVGREYFDRLSPKNNSIGISMNIFGWDKKDLVQEVDQEGCAIFLQQSN